MLISIPNTTDVRLLNFSIFQSTEQIIKTSAKSIFKAIKVRKKYV